MRTTPGLSGLNKKNAISDIRALAESYVKTEICKIFNSNFFTEHLGVTDSVA